MEFSLVFSKRRRWNRFAGCLAAAFLFAAPALIPVPPALAQDSAEPDSPRPIRFVAWNLKNYLAMERRVGGEIVPDAPKPDKEIEPLIATLAEAQPDILGVCELGDSAYLADLQQRLKAAGIDLPHTELVISADGWNRNLGLLSRYPIVSTNSREGDELSYLIGQTRLPVQRGILDATIAVTGSYRLRLIGLHLKSKRDVPDADQFEMRRNEAHLAREHINAILDSEPGTNLIVYGDFNDTPDQPAPRTIRGKFGTDGYLKDLRPVDSDGDLWTHYWSFADTYARLDYLLVSEGLAPEIVDESDRILDRPDWAAASDHRALLVDLIPKDKPIPGRN